LIRRSSHCELSRFVTTRAKLCAAIASASGCECTYVCMVNAFDALDIKNISRWWMRRRRGGGSPLTEMPWPRTASVRSLSGQRTRAGLPPLPMRAIICV
jgi:hypothetical protein